MDLFYFALWQVMIIAVTAKNNELKTLTLEIQFPDHVSTIKFWRVNRALANEHLPVWITKNKPGKEFKQLKVMKNVGKVSFFHDTCTKSSLVYYHKRHEIDGVIGLTYYIKRLQIDEKAEIQHIDHRALHLMNHHAKTYNTRSTRSIDNTTLNRSLRNPQRIFYLEMLIVINNKAFNAIEENSGLPCGVATVSHVLTVYNAADLVYRLLRSPQIQLNIAGIVIEGIPNQWTFESEVILDLSNEVAGASKVYVNANSMHTKISNYFWLWQNNFPRHSYDMIQYLTTSLLKDEEGNKILGQAVVPLVLNTYMFPPKFFKDRVTTINRIFESYKHFLTIAHETAHTFTVLHDGTGEYSHLFDKKSCGNSLMADKAICLDSCLKWSPQAYAEFENYFNNQPARCNLLNYPRSLDVPEPKKVHSIAEQCECYGYEPFLEQGETVPENECDLPIICQMKNLEDIVQATLPMDGTPCGSTKVCWNKKCVEYGRNSTKPKCTKPNI